MGQAGPARRRHRSDGLTSDERAELARLRSEYAGFSAGHHDSGPNAAARPDLIGRDFTVNSAAIDICWCGDITFINT
ncbi:hypothetical protein ACWEOZ_12235 [Actinoplanes sp. NPDC004185]